MASELLKSAGLRCTHRREVILNVLAVAHAPMTADEVHAQAILYDQMGLSTTYRVLYQLTERGLLLKNDGSDGRSYYQLANEHAHQHTLHCAGCGAVVPIDGCPLAALEDRLTEETGYVITGHSLAFTGLCPACQSKGSPGTPHTHSHTCK